MAKLAMTLKIRVAIMMFFLAELQIRGGGESTGTRDCGRRDLALSKALW